jgi:excisionase family DNA binding protein
MGDEASPVGDVVGTDPRVSTAEAARRLGLSTTTVLRMIHDGELLADRVTTRRNTPAYLVTLPAGGTAWVGSAATSSRASRSL